MVASLLLALPPPSLVREEWPSLRCSPCAMLLPSPSHPPTRLPLPPLPRVAMQFDAKLFERYANPPEFKGSERRIVEYPSPILRARNQEVTDFGPSFSKLCAEMFSIMYAANGVGIAAPQVGLNERLFVYNTDPTAPGALKKLGERVVANPRIMQYCKPWESDIEGCLSSRSECCCGQVTRSVQIDVEYQDERGRLKKKKLRGFEARVFQHEYDHIEGVLHIDRQLPSDRRRIQPFLDVLEEQHGPGGAPELDPDVAATLQPPPSGLEMENAITIEETKETKDEVSEPSAKRDESDMNSSRGFGSGPKGSAPSRRKATKKKRK